MQVTLDETTVQFILTEADLNGWNRQVAVIADYDYWDDDQDGYEGHNLAELCYRIYTKNKEKFEGV